MNHDPWRVSKIAEIFSHLFIPPN